MDNFDDQPLERTASQDVPIVPPRTPSRTPVLVVAILGLIAGGMAAWWWTRADRPAPAAVATNATEATIASPAEAPRMLPPLAQMDTFLRALLGTLSAHPDFARWLATDNLITQTASGLERIARGQTPSADLPMFRPAGDFEVTRRGGTITITDTSFRRYDRVAALVDSLEPRGVVEAYRTVQPRLDEAYRALGRVSGGVDAAVDSALQLLIETPVPDEPITLVPGKGATYAYRDPQLEQLTPIQKQLLRMGPDNMRRIQARLRAIRAELTRSDNRVR
jgi:hypothetical protein